MTTARMHSQRQVQRGKDVARYTGQKPITRGGAAVTTPPVIPATGATAGIPGTWTPAGATPPADPAAMTGIVASPATAWTTGQFMQTALAAAPGRVTWSGTDWVGGVAP